MHKSTNVRMYSAVIKLCGRIAPGVVFIAASLFALQIAPGMTIKAGERTPKIRSLQWVKGAFKVLPLPRSGGRSLTYAKIVWWIRNIVQRPPKNKLPSLPELGRVKLILAYWQDTQRTPLVCFFQLTYVLPASTRPSSTLSWGHSTLPMYTFSFGQVHVSWSGGVNVSKQI